MGHNQTRGKVALLTPTLATPPANPYPLPIGSTFNLARRPTLPETVCQLGNCPDLADYLARTPPML